MDGFTHLNERGEAHMVDVSKKAVTARTATAVGRLYMAQETIRCLLHGDLPKGDALAVARIGGIAAAKCTPQLIMLCHSLPLEGVEVELEPDEAQGFVLIHATARVTGKTGIEMEALTAVTLAALNLYDMCKAVDPHMHLEGVHLERKTGGRSGDFQWEE